MTATTTTGVTTRIAAEIAPYRTSVLVAVAMAILWALWVAWGDAALATVALAAAAGAALGVIDRHTHRLPNAITYPATGAAAALLTIGALLSGDWQALGRAGLGAVLLGLFYLVLHLINRAGMGLGDVKLAPLLGGVTGWFGWNALAGAAVLPFLVGGAVAVVLLATRRANRSTALAFGPFMLIGAALALTWVRVTA